ncbi:MAG: hypothetical protein OSB09_02005 [Planctomycetota bacterium]|nr:hypothetical protein [Planctomycetota bacterium]
MRFWSRSGAIVLLVLLGFLPCGCKSIDIPARIDDLTDTVRARVGAGLGLYGEIEATGWLHPAIGFVDANLSPRFTIGHDPRPGQPAGVLRSASFPTMLVAFPFEKSPSGTTDDSATSPALKGWLNACMLRGNHHVEGQSCSLMQWHRKIHHDWLIEAPSLAQLSEAQRSSRNTWFAISGTLGVVTIDVGIHPLEVLDALLGWFGVDLMEDDLRRQVPAPTVGEEEA